MGVMSHCPRCDRTVEGPRYTVPVHLPAKEPGVMPQNFCYRAVNSLPQK